MWNLGPLPLRGYALCIILGILAAIWIGERRWVARGGKPGEVSDLAVWAVPFGLVGGRLYHVLTDYQLYFGEDNNPVTALYLWRGGLGVWGAIAMGALGVVIGARRKGIRLLPVLDAMAPGVLVAQAIGRWGNWFNQELFGRPTDLPWGLEIDAAHRPPRLPRRRDLPPDVPLRVPVVPRGVRVRRLGRPPLPARPRPGARALRDGLHAGPRLDRDAPHRRRPAAERAGPAPQRVDLDHPVRRRGDVLRRGGASPSRPRGAALHPAAGVERTSPRRPTRGARRRPGVPSCPGGSQPLGRVETRW